MDTISLQEKRSLVGLCMLKSDKKKNLEKLDGYNKLVEICRALKSDHLLQLSWICWLQSLKLKLEVC
jgi:hypothetical protein